MRCWIVAALIAFTGGLLRAQESHVVIVSIEGFAAARLEDSELELPNLRGITRSGARAEGMETVYPATDHPAHVSLVTGVPPRQHGVLGNRLLNRRTGEYFHVTNLPRSKSIRVPTLFDAAKAKGLRTASFFWPGTRDDPAIDHAIPLVLTGEGKADIAGANPQFLDELRENGVPIDLFYQWYDDLALQQTADRVLTRAAIYVLTTYRPHLLLLRLPAPDRYQHQYGPQHYLSKAALTASDYNIGLVRRAIEDSGLANQTTLVVVSDHGFHTAEYSVNVYPVFEKAGLANKVRLHGGYWSVVVELTDRFEESKDGKALEDALSRAARLDGVAVVVRPEDFHALGIPRYDEDPHILGQYLIIGSIDTRLVVDEQDSSSRRERLPTPYYGHGFLPSDERMYAVFLATGRRVRMGVRVGRVQNYDLAPTVCDLLGLDMPGLPGRILTEILE